MLKHISQLASLADYKKACAGDGKVLSDKPTSFVLFPKFPFSKSSTGPVLLLGNVPGPVLAEAKKKGGTCITGKASIKEGKVELEGTSAKVSPSAMNAALAGVGVSKKVAATSADDEDDQTTTPPKTKFPDPLKAPPKGPEPMKSKALGETFKDEDKKFGWRAQGKNAHLAESDRITTKYMNDEEKKHSEIGFDDEGNMVDSSGSPMGSANVGFVGDASNEGQLHKFTLNETSTDLQGRRKNTHHSSPVRGGAVTGAGQISTNPYGKLEEITDQSGHYKPNAELTHQTVKKMAQAKDDEGFEKNLVNRARLADGPMNKPAKVTLVGKQGFSQEEWDSVKDDKAKLRALAKSKFGDHVTFRDDELRNHTIQSINMLISSKSQISLTTQQFLQTEGNEKQIRAKINLNKDLEEKGKKKRDELDGPASVEAPQTNAKMSPSEFKKLGGNPATLKEPTKNAKPITRLSEKDAQKLASDAVANDNSSRAGKKLGPQAGILGRRQQNQPAANLNQGVGPASANPNNVISVGYVGGMDQVSPDSANNPSTGTYNNYQPSNQPSLNNAPVGSDGYVIGSAPTSSSKSGGYSTPKLNNNAYSTPAVSKNKSASLGYVTPVQSGEYADSDDSPTSPTSPTSATSAYAEPNLPPKKSGYAPFKPGKKKP